MHKTEWRVYAKKAEFHQLAEDLGVSPFTVRVMRNRDLITKEEMQEFLSEEGEYHDPWLLKDMKKAVSILQRKIGTKRKILIIGDYDGDGVCAAAILYKALKKIGAEVSFRLPHRMLDGYGMNKNMVEEAMADGIDTILTCDNGISAVEEIRYAKEAGMTVIVTDHHDIPEKGIPDADAVIDPKQEDCSYPFKNICGAVVSWKLICALYESLGIPKRFAEEYLPYCAIATVTDVMELRGENRTIVKYGLSHMAQMNTPGIRALAEVNGIHLETLTSYQIGFVIGPCINASGRLDTAVTSLELLLETNEAKAMELAERLKNYNDERKSMTMNGLEEARNYVISEQMEKEKVFVIDLPDCHESLAGIIAGKIREEYYRPTIVLTNAADGGLKGSARSIPGYNMFKELEKVSDLMTKFGGHPMAAGMSLPKENLALFRQRLNENCTLTDQELVEKIWIDIALPLRCITEEWVDEMKVLEPFGNGNEKPVFAEKNLSVKRAIALGKERKVLRLAFLTEDGYTMNAVYFGNIDEFYEKAAEAYGEENLQYMQMGMKNDIMLSILYYPDINEYRGQRTLQIVMKDYKFQK